MDKNNLINKIITWGEAARDNILKNGNPPDARVLKFAEQIGIQHPNKIKILLLDKVPLPQDPQITLVAHKSGLSLDNVGGITFGYGIILLKSRKDDDHILCHELTHVKQYENLGFKEFLNQYVNECLKNGYLDSPLEKEADETADRICGFSRFN